MAHNSHKLKHDLTYLLDEPEIRLFIKRVQSPRQPCTQLCTFFTNAKTKITEFINSRTPAQMSMFNVLLDFLKNDKREKTKQINSIEILQFTKKFVIKHNLLKN